MVTIIDCYYNRGDRRNERFVKLRGDVVVCGPPQHHNGYLKDSCSVSTIARTVVNHVKKKKEKRKNEKCRFVTSSKSFWYRTHVREKAGCSAIRGY